jgi:hypothetical protein
VAAQFAEQLLEVRQGNLLALADGSQGDRPVVLAQSQVNHGGDSETAFGGETHKNSCKAALSTGLVNYNTRPNDLVR